QPSSRRYVGERSGSSAREAVPLGQNQTESDGIRRNQTESDDRHRVLVGARALEDVLGGQQQENGREQGRHRTDAPHGHVASERGVPGRRVLQGAGGGQRDREDRGGDGAADGLGRVGHAGRESRPLRRGRGGRSGREGGDQ